MITGFDNIFCHHIIMQICNDGKIRKDYQCAIGRRAIWLRGKGAKSHRELNLSTHSVVETKSTTFCKSSSLVQKTHAHWSASARAQQPSASSRADSLSSVLVSFAQLRLCLFTTMCSLSHAQNASMQKILFHNNVVICSIFYGGAIS